jgi:glycogen synthase
MKILIIAIDDIPHIGGKSTHIFDLMDGLKEKGHKVYLLSHKNIPKYLQYLMKALLYPYRYYNRGLYIYYYQKLVNKVLQKKIKKICVEKKIDLISAQDSMIASACGYAVQKLNIPVALTMHTYFAIENTLDNSLINNNTTKLMLKQELNSLNNVKAITAVDKRIKNHVKKYMSELGIKNVALDSIPNFTNVSIFKPSTLQEKLELRSTYGVKEESFVIVCSRRLVEKNGVLYAVKAMKYLKDDTKSLLLIVGDGKQQDIIENYINEQGLKSRVKMLGSIQRDKITEIYKLANASIVPSITVNGLQEATSISAIEAMACGLPTIASDIGGLKELIINGENGFLIPEMDEKAIAEKISILENDKKLYNDMSIRSSTYIRKYHSHKTTAEKYLFVYNTILNK